MVEIPTSRYVDRVSANSGRSLVRLPQVDPGQATQGLGRALQGLGQDVAQIAIRNSAEMEQKRSYDVQVNAERFRQQEEQAFLEAGNNASGSGIGFTRNFLEGHQKRANEWVEQNLNGVDEKTDAALRKSLLSLGSTLFTKASVFEDKAKTAYYDANTNESLDGIRRQIRANSAPFDNLREQGARIIASADMPQMWKEARAREWAADAAESKWQFAYEKDPQGAVDALRDSGVATDARGLLREFEGFRETPYWDVNALRAGYGSDTVTRADGSVERVAKGTRVSRADAERDLARRAAEFEKAAAVTVGEERWAGLPPNARAALTSVAYNYGSLPDSVVKAIDTGDTEEIASAVEGLKGHNGGVNSKRRQREADIIRGGAMPASGGEYDDIPYDRQQQLVAAGEREIQANGVRESTAAKEDLGLRINVAPEAVSAADILADERLDSGQKDELITKLRGRMKESEDTNNAFARYKSGDTFNGFDSDDRKSVDLIYKSATNGLDDNQKQAVSEELTRSTTTAPSGVVAGLRGDLASTDAKTVAGALQRSQRLMTASDRAFAGHGGGDEIARDTAAFNHLVNDMGFSPERAAQSIIDGREKSNNPVDKKALGDFMKKLGPGDLTSAFDASWLPFNAPGMGPASQGAAIMADYRDLAERFYVESRDPEQAKAKALHEMKRLYGVSDYAGESRIMRYPPEAYYPPVGGAHDYIAKQALDDVRAATGEEIKPDDFWMVAAPGTGRQVQSGQPPRYQIFYMHDLGDGVNEIRTLSQEWGADIGKARSDLKSEIEKAQLSGEGSAGGLQGRYREAVDKDGSTVVVDTYTKEIMQQDGGEFVGTGRRYGRGVMVSPEGTIIPRQSEARDAERKAAQDAANSAQAEDDARREAIDPFATEDATRAEFLRRQRGGR